MAVATSVERKIKKLEDEVKALKSAYRVAGALAKMYVEESDTFPVGGSSSIHDVEFAFTPTYGLGQNNIIAVSPIVYSVWNGATTVRVPGFTVLPQDDSGVVKIKISGVTNAETVKLIAAGTSPGTFSRVG